MADTDNIFDIGSVVTVTPAIGPDVTGEVMAFDQKSRILVLKQPASNKKSTQCDIITLYTSKVKNITIISEPDSNAVIPPLPTIDLTLLRKRFDKAVVEKKIICDAMNSGAPLDGQQIYLRIAKCLTCKWSERDEIVVMDEVAVVPPYTSNCVRACNHTNHQLIDNSKQTKMLEYVKKMVDKYYEDKQKTEKRQPGQQQQAPSASSEPSQH